MFSGCLPPKIDLRDYKVKASKIQTLNLPETFQLESYSKVKNQKTVGSCVAHATSEILEYYDKGAHTLSTNFIYGIQKKVCDHDGKGMYLQDACKIVQKYGDMLEQDCPGNNEVPTCYSIAENALDDEEKANRALTFRITNYFSCDSIQDIKYAIYNYGPVLGMIYFREKYSIDSNAIIHMDMESEGGYHAIMLIGWNETGFIFQNSWGSLFGKKGIATIPYDIAIEDSKVLIDYDNTEDESLKVKNYGKLATAVLKFINSILNLFNQKN